MSLGVWYLSFTNHALGWSSEGYTTDSHPLNSQCLYCMSPENHILRRGTQSTAMPPWTGKFGYTIWTFHWRLCCSTKNITIAAFIGSQTAESAETFQRETIAKAAKKNSGLVIMGCDGRVLCLPLMSVPRWEAPLQFPRMLWGVWDWNPQNTVRRPEW